MCIRDYELTTLWPKTTYRIAAHPHSQLLSQKEIILMLFYYYLNTHFFMIIIMPFHVIQTVRGGCGWNACRYCHQKCDSVGTNLPRLPPALLPHTTSLRLYLHKNSHTYTLCPHTTNVFSHHTTPAQKENVHPNGIHTLIANLKAACCADNLSCLRVCVCFVPSFLRLLCWIKSIFSALLYIYINTYQRRARLRHRESAALLRGLHPVPVTYSQNTWVKNVGVSCTLIRTLGVRFRLF